MPVCVKKDTLLDRGSSLPQAAVDLLQGVLTRTPKYEAAYVTLAKIHFSAGRSKKGIAVLERLLQMNPKHAVALELLYTHSDRNCD